MSLLPAASCSVRSGGGAKSKSLASNRRGVQGKTMLFFCSCAHSGPRLSLARGSIHKFHLSRRARSLHTTGGQSYECSTQPTRSSPARLRSWLAHAVDPDGRGHNGASPRSFVPGCASWNCRAGGQAGGPTHQTEQKKKRARGLSDAHAGFPRTPMRCPRHLACCFTVSRIDTPSSRMSVSTAWPSRSRISATGGLPRPNRSATSLSASGASRSLR